MVPETVGLTPEAGAGRPLRAASPGGLPVTLLLGLLAVATFASRWWLRTDYLVGPDALQTAASVQLYDVSLHLPHPPGQPVTAAVLRLLDLAVRSPHHSVIALACMADALAAVLIFWLGALACSRRAGVVAALVYALSPMGWISSTLGMGFSLDACMGAAIGVTVVAMLRKPGGLKAVALGALLGAFLGMRNNVNWASAALLPVGFYGLWRVRPWGALAGVGAFAAALAAWAVPAVLWGASGSGYVATVGQWWSLVGWPSCALHALVTGGGLSAAAHVAAGDIAGFARESFHGLGVAALLLPFVVVPARFAGRDGEPAPWRLATLWLLPAGLLPLVGNYHVEEYAAVAMPVLVLLTAVGLLRVSWLLRSALAWLGARRREGDDRLGRAFIVTHVLAICVLNVLRLSVHLAEQPNESRTIGGRHVIALGVQMVAAPRSIDLNAAYLRTVADHCRGRRAVLIAASRLDFIQLYLYVPGQLCVLPVRQEADGLRVLLASGGRIESTTLAKGSHLPLPREVELVMASAGDKRVRFGPSDGLAEAKLTPRESRVLDGQGRKRIFMVRHGPLRLYCAGEAIELSAAAGATARAGGSGAGAGPASPPRSEASQ